MNNIHQVGGNHYSRLKIQPIELFKKYNLNWFQGEIIKYVSRYKYKNGLEDLKKAYSILTSLPQEAHNPILSDTYLEKYINQFNKGFLLEPGTSMYFRSLIYNVVYCNYLKAVSCIELIMYSEYEYDPHK